ncbi:flavodoxin domain-containing protein [Actinomyces sp. MRS3W]|uniref:flavodoxin domain-containing protein n=1 Tax=Actinomyces sp. MRS3W TaxID=2800796 RepID=UPI0028FD937A|nr:flavodoxin domain-containing protein [Actinomyces sp. MRS3W]MDU0349216.1 flavodoxin domain-containing protein [Actinomyces sp. MRS3W]
MTTALIIVESCFGNTRALAEAVAAGARQAGAQAQVVDVAHAPAQPPAGTDLLVLGAPTHNRGLSRAATRAQAGSRGGTPPVRGMREWLETAVIPGGLRMAVFDTVTGRNWLAGSAAKAIAKVLGRIQHQPGSVRSFVVAGVSGPLADGEEDAACAWGAGLVSAP